MGCFLDCFIVTVFPLAEPPAALAVGGHHRAMAGKLRELAHHARTPQMRKELIDLAKYDRRGDYLDQREE
jgi:hypothetical protein